MAFDNYCKKKKNVPYMLRNSSTYRIPKQIVVHKICQNSSFPDSPNERIFSIDQNMKKISHDETYILKK